MNKVYKVKFHPSKGVFIACSELSKNKGKTQSLVKATAVMALLNVGLFATPAGAVACSGTQPGGAQLYNNTTYTNDCSWVIDQGVSYSSNNDTSDMGYALGVAEVEVTFNENYDIQRANNPIGTYKADKGIITLSAGSGNFTVNGNLTMDTTQKADDNGLSMILLRKNNNLNQQFLLQGQNNKLTATTDPSAKVGYYAGAAVHTYSNFTVDNELTIEIDGKNNSEATINGVAGYGGKLSFGELNINTHLANSVAGDDKVKAASNSGTGNNKAVLKQERRLAGLLLSGGEATFNGPVTIQDTASGAGIALISYYSVASNEKYANSINANGGDRTYEAMLKDDLTITTQDGAGIVLGSGRLTQDVSKNANITSQGAGHGIEITDTAGILANNDKSTSNVITLGGGIATGSDSSIDIALGEKATVQTTSGNSIHIGEVAGRSADKTDNTYDTSDNTANHINDINITNAGNIISDSGNAIDASAFLVRNNYSTQRHVNITNTGTISSNSGSSVLGSGNDDTFTSTGGLLKGDVSMNDGSDTVIIRGSDIAGVKSFDGGDDVTNNNNWIDTLNLHNVTYNLGAGGDLINWENINLNDNTTLNLYKDLTVGDDAANGMNGLTISTGTAINVGGIDPDATNPNPIPAVTISGRVANAGTIDLGDNNAAGFTELTIAGDYVGNGGTIVFDTKLGDDNSPTDKLVLQGNVSGTTNVAVRNKGGQGALTNKGIQLIDTTGASNTNSISNNAFTLANSVEAGAYEYNTLAHNAGEGFYLQSRLKPVPPTPQNPNPPAQQPDAPYQPALYRPAVSGYVMAQHANQAAALGMLGNHLHQRMGEQHIDTFNQHNKQAWGRIRVESQTLKGKRQFEIDNQTQLVQFGWDLAINRDNQNARNHSGVYVGYANNSADVFDNKRDTANTRVQTGNIDADVLSVGAYHTRFDEQGSYIDLIGGLHYVDNDYSDMYNGSADNTGIGISASAEAGWHHKLNNGFFVEPQAQLTAQTTYYNGFDDGITHIDSYNSNSLRPRLGVRAGYKDAQSGKDIYMTANIIHELLAPATVNIGDTGVKDEIGKDTWLEVGLGGQLPAGENTIIYGSAQYHHTLGDSSRRGGSGQVGLRYSW